MGKKMAAIRQLVNQKFTIMIIPETNKKVFQLKLNNLFTYALLLSIASIFMYFIISTVYLGYENDFLDSSNETLVEELLVKDDRIDKLSVIVAQQQEENDILKASVTTSAEYFAEKISELNMLENQIVSAAQLINEKSEMKIELPTSRSLDRTTILSTNEDLVTANSTEDLLNMNKDDEITTIINTQIDDMSNMIDQLGETFTFLEAKPDGSPTSGRITSGFGYRRDPFTGLRSFHKGLDIANSRNTPVNAAGSGVVTFAGYNGSYGYVIVISHGFDYKSVYAHNQKILVEVGDQVEKGDQIALMGNSGKSTGPHLHFEIHYQGVQIDPRTILLDY